MSEDMMYTEDFDPGIILAKILCTSCPENVHKLREKCAQNECNLCTKFFLFIQTQ